MKRQLFVTLLVFAFAVPGSTQQSSSSSAPQPSKPGATQSANPENSANNQAESSDQAVGKQIVEQEAGDPNAQFTQSPSVQALGRLLHVSTATAYLISVVLNFAIVAIAILIAAKKFLPGLLKSRNEAIQKQLEEARRASEDAGKRLRDIETRLGRLGSEITALHAEASAQSKDEEARFKAGVEEEKARIVRGAEQEIAAAAANVRRELQSYAAELAVDLAEKKIKIDGATDKTLVHDFVEQLGRNGK